MLNVFLLISYIILAAYLFFGLFAIYGIIKKCRDASNKTTETNPLNVAHQGISILIPCRNESENIIHLLSDLKVFSANCGCEIIVVDDHSEDETFNKVSKYPFVKLIKLPENKAGKKAAITEGVTHCSNEVILCLDADVRVPKSFSTQKIIAIFSTHSTCNFLIFPLKINFTKNFFGIFHLLEHLALTSFMLGFARNNKAFLAHGACMAFRKKAFEEVKGFDGNLNISSGDDIFLLEKMKSHFPLSVSVHPKLTEPVSTNPVRSFQQLFSQRIRWASKFNKNKKSINFFLSITVGLLNFFLLFAPFFVFINQLPLTTYFIVAGIKFLIDFLLLFLSSVFFKQTKYLWFYPFFFWLYPLFAFMLMISVFFIHVKWKGRSVS